MKTKIAKGLLLGAALIVIATLASSCVSTYTKVTAPDGTITETSTRGPDAPSVNAAANLGGVVGGIYMRKIIAEK